MIFMIKYRLIFGDNDKLSQGVGLERVKEELISKYESGSCIFFAMINTTGD